MTIQAWVSLGGLLMTLFGAFVASIVVLVKTTWKLSAIMVRIEILEEKYAVRETKLSEFERAVSTVGLLEDGYSSLKEKLGRHDSHITELRVTTGILDRQSQGEFG